MISASFLAKKTSCNATSFWGLERRKRKVWCNWLWRHPFFHQKRCSWTNTIHTSPMEGMGMIKGLFRERMCQLGVAMFELMNPISFLLGHSSSEILVLAHFLQRSYEAAGLLEKESWLRVDIIYLSNPQTKKVFLQGNKTNAWRRECLSGLSSSKCLLEETRDFEILTNLKILSGLQELVLAINDYLQHSNNSRWICRLFDQIMYIYLNCKSAPGFF